MTRQLQVLEAARIKGNRPRSRGCSDHGGPRELWGYLLFLMRAGRFLAEDSPDGLRRRTGAPDVETAFLRLIDAAGQRTEASA